ncbi:hypothetical protein [Pseudoalteromonas marina]|uniref:hypothetical protein n=1 Tax=Pseudoalteromonas marina TaxID=267375 RepID=UPI0027346F26|nr:hypothetical protein [Pseudoalteromonas marina]MDP2485783.1 hypothetical protein [Pseudoalteromonas marina]
MITDFFHNLYNATFKIKNPILVSSKVAAVLRLVILGVSNIVIPIVYAFTKNNSQYNLKSNTKKQSDFVVSLTSFPQRIGKAHLVIESLLRQTVSPKRIVLWLSEQQFTSLDVLPKKLLELQARGLEIYLTEGDLRSYKKYYFLLKESPSSKFIIFDDDIFYQSKVVEYLIDTHKKYPNALCANRCRKIDNTQSYANWKIIKGDVQTPRFDLMPTGCGGVLYPENALHTDSIDKELFTKICKDADDIWLNTTAYLNKTPIAYTGKFEYVLAVISYGNIHLHSKNVGESNNDIRMRSVEKHYLSSKSIKVFDRDNY